MVSGEKLDMTKCPGITGYKSIQYSISFDSDDEDNDYGNDRGDWSSNFYLCCACAPGSYMNNASLCVERKCSVDNGGCTQQCNANNNTCGCNPGFHLDSNQFSCSEQDMCEDAIDGSKCSQLCTTTNGQRVCSCIDGYVLKDDGVTCDHINPCASNATTINGGCQQDCLPDVNGTRTCACFENFVIAADGVSCNRLEPTITQVLNSPRAHVRSNVTIAGTRFGQDNMTITIGNVACLESILINSSFAICDYPGTADPNPSGDALEVVINFTGVSARAQLFLYADTYECPNACSGHGQCINTTGECICSGGYVMNDCSIAGAKPPMPLPNENGGTIFPVTTADGSTANFSLDITHVREISSSNSVVRTLPLSSVVWTSPNQTTPGISIYMGTFPNDSLSILVHATYFQVATSIEFAGEPISITANSVKYQITMSNWTFSQNINSLHLVYHVRAGAPSSCDAESRSTVSNDGAYPSLQVEQGGVLMRGRFASRAIVDGRFLKARVVALDAKDELYSTLDATTNTLVASVVPFFIKSASIDPNFGVIVALDKSNDPCGKSEKRNWVLPVIIVCSVVGAALIVVGAALLFKTKAFRFKVHQLKMKKMSA
eukprot:gene9140-10719_t